MNTCCMLSILIYVKSCEIWSVTYSNNYNMRGNDYSISSVIWDINALSPLLQLIEDDSTDIRLFNLQAKNIYQNYREWLILFWELVKKNLVDIVICLEPPSACMFSIKQVMYFFPNNDIVLMFSLSKCINVCPTAFCITNFLFKSNKH